MAPPTGDPDPGTLSAALPSVQPEAIVPTAFAQPLPPPRDVPQPPPRAGEPPTEPSNAPAIRGGAPSVGGPLALDEVLRSVEQHYPLLRAVEQERAAAGGRLLSSMGAFDLNLTGGTEGQTGTYDNYRGTAGLVQGLPFGGLGLFGGYRQGYGDFPTYYLNQKTAEGGEFRAGVTVPLLQNRSIDRARAGIQQARIDVEIAEPTIERQRLDFLRAAARSYWSWVAAGHRLRVAESLVQVAVDREAQIRRRVREGATPNIERIDNEQNIALRNGVLVQAQRALQQATIELSLFLRDTSGSPTLAGLDRLPAFPEVTPPDLGAFEEYLAKAFEQRPEPRRLRLQRERAMVDLRRAENQTLPALNAVVAASQDVGYGKSSLSGPNGLDRTNVSGGLALALPLQRREARGRVQTVQAQLAQIGEQLRNVEDVVRAEVQDAFSAVERAAEFHRQAAARVDLARMVARAERERLLLGNSDVLRVTLREQAAFEAEIIEIGARQDYFRSLAELRAAIGDATP